MFEMERLDINVLHDLKICPPSRPALLTFFSVLGHSVEKQKLDGLLIHFQNIGLILTLFWRHKFLIFQSIFIEFILKEEFYNSV